MSNDNDSKKYIKDLMKKNKMNEQLLDRNFEKFSEDKDKEVTKETVNEENPPDSKLIELQEKLLEEKLLEQELLKQKLLQQKIQQESLEKDNGLKDVSEETNNNEEDENNSNSYLKDKLKKDLKEPLLIILIVLFYTNNNIILKISNYVPGMIYENSLTTIGTLLRAVFIAITIYIIKKLIG